MYTYYIYWIFYVYGLHIIDLNLPLGRLTWSFHYYKCMSQFSLLFIPLHFIFSRRGRFDFFMINSLTSTVLHLYSVLCTGTPTELFLPCCFVVTSIMCQVVSSPFIYLFILLLITALLFVHLDLCNLSTCAVLLSSYLFN